MIIPKEFIICILNELYNSSQSIEIIYPPIGKLFSIELGEKCIVKPISENSYNNLRNQYIGKNNNKKTENEIPSASDFRECLYASSILISENESYLEDLIRQISARNLLNNSRPVFIGYDTNALIYRSNRLVENLISKISKDKSVQIGFCLSKNVRNELSDQWNVKYRDFELPIPKLSFTINFLNQHPKDARRARLAAIEEKHIVEMSQYKEAKSSGKVDGKGDRVIIDSYKKFQRDNDVDLLLISGDDGFKYMAETDRMDSIFIKYPSVIENFMNISTDWEGIIQLIFCTAIIFGYIELENIRIYGVWIGKKGEDWDSYKLEIKIDDFKLEAKVSRDARIIEEAIKELIPKPSFFLNQ